MAVEAVVLKCESEEAPHVTVPTHDTQGVEGAVDLGALILNQEEFAGVPARAVRTRPPYGISARVARILTRSTEGLSFSFPVTKKHFQGVVLRAALRDR